MRKLILGVFLTLVFAVGAQAQTCPTGMVCVTQETANRLFDAVTQLTAAQEAISKLTASQTATQVALDRALSLIERYKDREAIDNQISLKKDELVAAATAIADLWKKHAEDLQAQLNKPRSTWDKIWGALKRVLDVAAGIGIGRIL